MKRLTIALLATAAALAANSARADTRVSVGVNLGGPAYRPAPPAVVYAPAPPPTVVYAPAPVPARGYWKDVTMKTWVPERWVSSRDRWGRPVRVCDPGYYTYTTNRVWVDGRHEHYNRGYAYGYDNNRRDYDTRGDYDNRGGWNR